MGNQPPVRRVEVITYEEPVPPPPEPTIEVDVSVNEYGDVIETETIITPDAPPPYVQPVVVETFVEPVMPPYVQPYVEPIIETEVVYDPYDPQPVVVEEYYGGEPGVEVTTYSYDNSTDSYVDYEDYPDTEPYFSDDVEPYYP